ncbi:copper amine oxidase [Talaromyces proteolyticus]|uniref:Amine oxidase n=1 Tax=Talaromyces proteolyticus TaxID=1131652 RepID=A0AAD4PYN2_9EURO|nr:copper amine oxidase [Talaromyces proteolyticus]KAH8695338.1 copper amine oxidase [Talaromyces proteolyticus]
MTESKVHPLTGLSSAEIKRAAAILQNIYHKNDGVLEKLRFQHITLQEPPKELLMLYLDAECAGVEASERPFVPRLAEITYREPDGPTYMKTVVSLDTDTEVSTIRSQQGQHGGLDRAEVIETNIKILTDPDVRREIAKFNLPENVTVQCDTWPYGSDNSSEPDHPKLIQCILYARASHNHPESNQYSFPLPISPVYDPFQKKLVRIDPIATGGKEDGLAYRTVPADVALAHCTENEYFAELQKTPQRKDLKPLLIVQPEGVSFDVQDGSLVSWQKWSFRVGFNWREGMTVHDVRYDGRKVFYRLSLSEMTVPYSDPRSPLHRRQAFDLGDAGAGSCANQLALGCDCLGSIHYFDSWLSDDQGNPVHAKNVICLHEQDGGIGWKHTNPRTDVAAVTRKRVLILQSIITVGNYEYIFAWQFQQSGTVEFDTRATGILATSLIDAGKTSYWGNVVSPGVLATNHQHLFCLRIDPMIDGSNNSFIQEEAVSLPMDGDNPHGNAWKIRKTPLERSGFADAAPLQGRIFKIVNEKQLNPISGNPVGFKLVPQPSQLLLADPMSSVHKRARFAEHHLWVTKYRDGDLWAGGLWTNQSLNEIDGVADYAARNENVRNEDIVIWHTYGLTHHPRVEDYPVMPVEAISVSLHPADFFDKNPASDVPVSTQSANSSVLVPYNGTSSSDIF